MIKKTTIGKTSKLLIITTLVIISVLSFWQIVFSANSAWTTKNDFSSNASTTSQTTTKNNMTIVGDNDADDSNDNDHAKISINQNYQRNSVAAGVEHSLAIKSDGIVYAAGRNDKGQLGYGGTSNRLSFGISYQNSGVALANVTSVSAGYGHSLALKSDGTVWATGYNITRQLGLGDTTNRFGWNQVKTSSTTYLTNVVAIAAGNGYSLALKSDGTLWGTGTNNVGQLGIPESLANKSYFTQSTTISDVVAIAAPAAGGSSVAIKSDGSVWTTGSNDYGQLGVGDTSMRTSFTPTDIISGAVSAAAGRYHTLILKSDGTVWGSGRNDLSQLGLTDTDNRTNFTKSTYSEINTIAAGGSAVTGFLSPGFSLFTNSAGRVYSTGGTGANDYTLGGVPVVSVAGGGLHSLAVSESNGTIMSAGGNGNGQLALGYTSAPTFGTTNFLGTKKAYSYFTNATIGNEGSGVGLRVDAGEGIQSNWNTINFTSSALIDNQGIKFRIRVADTLAGLSAAAWHGSAGSVSLMDDWSTNYFGKIYGGTNYANVAASGLPESRYAEVMVRIESDGTTTPSLNSVQLLSSVAYSKAPITTININPMQPDAYEGWYKTLPTITLTSDKPGSTFYQWDSTSGGWTTYGGVFTYPTNLDKKNDANGKHTLYFYSKDASTTEDVKFYEFKVDSNYQMPSGGGGSCDGCHGTGSGLIGGDHLSYYKDTPHDKALNDISDDGYAAVLPSGSPTRCNRCHYNSMKDGADGNPISPRYLRVTGANPEEPDGVTDPAGIIHTVTGNNNTLCFACHANQAGAFSGKAVYEQSIHSQNSGFSSAKAATRWSDANFKQGECGNCHNPHGVEGTTDYTRAANNNLCYQCHDNSNAPNKPETFKYRGKTAFENTEHGSSTNVNNKWPNTNDTGAAIGTGGNESGECINCHNPHGKNDGNGNVISKLTNDIEEYLCYGGGGACHAQTTGSVNGINIKDKFTNPARSDYSTDAYFLSTRHNVNSAEQDYGQEATSKLECTNCHNPHINGSNNKVANPDKTAESYSATRPDPKQMASVRLQGSGATTDTTITAASPADGGASTKLYVGKSGNLAKRALIKFDLSSIPAGATIQEASLLLPNDTKYVNTGGDLEVKVNRLIEDWDQAQASWSSRDGVNNWSIEGGSFDPQVFEVKNMPSASGGETLNLTSLVVGWASGIYPNYGLMISAPNAEAGPSDWLKDFDASENADWPANRPTLVVVYSTSVPTQIADEAGFCLKCHDGNTTSGVIMPYLVSSRYSPKASPTVGSVEDSLNSPKGFLEYYNGDYHGSRVGGIAPARVSAIGPQLRPGYYAGMNLSCNECHDPHGSSNMFHLKETINGKPINVKQRNADGTEMKQVCAACHYVDEAGAFHAAGGIPAYTGCNRCHFHGSKYKEWPGPEGAF